MMVSLWPLSCQLCSSPDSNAHFRPHLGKASESCQPQVKIQDPAMSGPQVEVTVVDPSRTRKPSNHMEPNRHLEPSSPHSLATVSSIKTHGMGSTKVTSSTTTIVVNKQQQIGDLPGTCQLHSLSGMLQRELQKSTLETSPVMGLLTREHWH